MNYSTAVMLINPHIRAVATIYEHEPEDKAGTQPRKLFKTLDPSIKVGDLVVVPTTTRHKFTVVKVVDVDVDVDFDSATTVEWVAGKVDLSAHTEILAEEGKWIETIRESEKRKKREEIKKNMLDMYADAGIDKLAIANMGQDRDVASLIESPKVPL